MTYHTKSMSDGDHIHIWWTSLPRTGIQRISWMGGNADHNSDRSPVFASRIIFCMECFCEPTRSFPCGIGFHICVHMEVSLNTCSNKGPLFRKLSWFLLFHICIWQKRPPCTGNFHNDTFSYTCGRNPFLFHKHYRTREQLYHRQLVVLRKSFHMDKVEADCKWLDIFCTIPCGNFIRKYVSHNSAFLGRLIRKDDLMASMSFCVNSIKYCNCAGRKSVFFCICYHISKFICGCELCSIRFFSWSIHRDNFESR